MQGKSRQEERTAQNDEWKKSILTLLKVIGKFFPDLFRSFEGTDPREKRRITYTVRFILTILFFKYALSIVSMRSMEDLFENSTIIANLALLGGMKGMLRIPCAHTINNLLMILPVSFLWCIRKKIIFKLIRSKRLDHGRWHKHFAIIIDATQTYGGKTPINVRCLKRVHSKGTEDEHTTYHRNVLEAKLWIVGTPFVFSICSVFIENDPGEGTNKKRSKEKIKQDCELAAFNRLAPKLNSDFPRLPIIILADALYISNNVLNLCNSYGWKFMIRYKKGAASTIQEYVDVAIKAGDLKTIPDQIEYKNIGYYTGIPYHDHILNYIQATVHASGAVMNMKWVTNIELKYNVIYILDVVRLGRGRWKIENQGFNRQKHWLGVLEHLCCWNDQALKNHYLMIQIADIFLTLWEMEEAAENEKKRWNDPDFKPIERTFQTRALQLLDGLGNISFIGCDQCPVIEILAEKQSAA